MQKKAGFIISLILFLFFSSAVLMAGEKEACLDCHEGDDFPPRFLEFAQILSPLNYSYRRVPQYLPPRPAPILSTYLR